MNCKPIITKNKEIYNNLLEENYTEKTGEILEDGKRPWHENRGRSEKLAQYFKRADKKGKASRVNECARKPIFKECNCGHKNLAFANFCRERLCPMCAWRKSLRMFADLKKIACDIHHERPTVRWVMLTLTVKNVKSEELSLTIDMMFASYKRLFELKVVKKAVLGWFRALEVTYNEEQDTYHPHFHILLCVPSRYFTTSDYIKHEEWQQLWKESARLDYEPEVHIQTVKANNRKSDDAMAGAIAEVGKYATKSQYLDFDESVVDKIYSVFDTALASRRLIAYGGLLRATKKKLKLEDVESAEIDLVNTDDKTTGCQCPSCGSAMWLHVYEWHAGIKKYIG